ncbi:MAG TPA: hypothetical protein VFM46_16245 [Pseudomonadales bacterium]|nr:hypothetical protein [Pseudomonadales bacterium]
MTFETDLPRKLFFLAVFSAGGMTKMTTKSRFIIALVLALSVIGFSAPAVLADSPVMYEIGPIYDNAVLSDMCSFPVSLSMTYTIAATDFFDQSGMLIRTHFHVFNQDTFSANGKTLVGLPYQANAEVRWNSDGTVASFYVNGVFEKVPLPNGTFNAAGRKDVTDNPFGFSLTPDNGTPGNIAGLCAALAP